MKNITLLIPLIFLLVWVGPTGASVVERYVIQRGDTLSAIAGYLLGDASKWREIWELNPEIKDPNLIYEGNSIRIKAKPPATPKEFLKIITDLAFEKSHIAQGLTQISHNDLLGSLEDALYRGEYQNVRDATEAIRMFTRAWELEDLLWSIKEVYAENPEKAKILFAIAWQESHFFSRIGKAGEIGYYQLLPSTICLLGYKNNMNLIKNSPPLQTQLALRYFDDLVERWGTLDKAIYHYNGGGKATYLQEVLQKRKVLEQRLRG